MKDIETLLKAMTFDEKIGQLNMAASNYAVTGPTVPGDVQEDVRTGRIGSLLNLWGAEEVHAVQRLAVEETRLGIPLLVALDVLHGHRTIFPVPLAEACLFDPAAWEETARIAALEATQDGIAMTFAPMIDVSRDPRWGRVVEGPGEDPWIASQFATAKTRGFQGTDLARPESLAATAKHFCAYGAPIAGREYASADISERMLREVYLPPFTAAVEAGAAAIMPGFNDIAGIPMTVHARLLQGWLRDRNGFEGVLISDYNAIAELCNHGVAADLVEASALALKAGVDIDMMSGAYLCGLPVALERGLVDLADIDRSVRRVLSLKKHLGLFDDPYARGRGAAELALKEHRHLARKVGRRAIVLLTHKNGVLPLPSETQRIALIGPLATATGEMLGSWPAAGRAEEAVSILEALTTALPQCLIETAPGVDIDGQDIRGLPSALKLCTKAEIVILCLGEAAAMSGEAASRGDLTLPGRQRELAEAILALGKPVIVLLTSGRPLTLPWLFERADAVLATWFLGSEAGHAIADVLTGRFNPTGRLPISWPYHVGQVPIFYAQRPSGRPTKDGERYTSSYLDLPVAPQFSFGHGLSYNDLELTDLCCDPASTKIGGSVTISVTVTNRSKTAGEATLFLFVRDKVASIARPVLELKGMRKVELAAEEHSRVAWSLSTDALTFVGQDLESVLEPGHFEIFVGESADPAICLTTSLHVASR